MNDRRIAFLSVLGVIAAAFLAGVAAAQPGTGRATTAGRIELAAAYLEFEEAFAGATLRGAVQRQVHRGFDYAASMFFAGRFSEAVQRMHQLTTIIELHEQHAAGEELQHLDADRLLRSLHVQFSPPVRVTSTPQEGGVRARFRSMYPIEQPEGDTIDVRITLNRAHGELAWEKVVLLGVGRSSIQHVADLDIPDDLAAGTYHAMIGDASSDALRLAGRFIVVDEAVEDQRSGLVSQLEAIRSDAAIDGTLQRAMAICRARINVLTGRPSAMNSIEFLLDPVIHARTLENEIKQLSAGNNPYHQLRGEHWRIVSRPGGESPVMVYAPRTAESAERLPLVIALHGAGGDETMFMRAYGAGMIRDLAESHNFIVASPLTYHVMADPSLIDRLIDDLSADYGVDKNRVFLLGHSLGAGTSTMLVNRHPDRFAAVCCIAGAGTFAPAAEGAAYPPVLVLAAELDTIIPPARLRGLVDAGSERGLPIEYRHKDNLGHVLVVNETLEEAVEWLLQHSR